MQAAGINLNIQQNLGLASHKITRFVYSLLRLIRNTDDYLAFRTILGIRTGVGISTCVNIANKVLSNSLNFKDQFGNNRTANLFSHREIGALDGVSTIINGVNGWSLSDLLSQRINDITNVLSLHMSPIESHDWINWANNLPTDMTLEELYNFLGARDEKDAREILFNIYTRLNLTLPPDLDPADRVRIMSLHSSKGLSAKVVFIPGLEDELLPGQYRSPYPAQIQEAARLLYVGITRARADCIISYSQNRKMNGRMITHTPSRFALNLGINFQQRRNGLTTNEINIILNNCRYL